MGPRCLFPLNSAWGEGVIFQCPPRGVINPGARGRGSRSPQKASHRRGYRVNRNRLIPQPLFWFLANHSALLYLDQSVTMFWSGIWFFFAVGSIVAVSIPRSTKLLASRPQTSRKLMQMPTECMRTPISRPPVQDFCVSSPQDFWGCGFKSLWILYNYNTKLSNPQGECWIRRIYSYLMGIYQIGDF